MKNNLWIWLLFFSLLSCEKQQEWLDVKSNRSDVVPTSLADLQAVMDNDLRLNVDFPSLGLLSSDHYLLSFANWQAAVTATERNAYVWNRDIYQGEMGYDWYRAYQRVALSNVVLDGLNRIEVVNVSSSYNSVKGTALFHRGLAFFHLVQGFCLPYSSANANSMGIPLKRTADINEKVFRSTLEESYRQILQDVQLACQLLPLAVPLKTRPGKQAALILLAKVQLAILDYRGALQSAEQAIALDNELLDFNQLDPKLDFPFPNYQQKPREIVFHASATIMSLFTGGKMLVEPALYQSYANEDLRKVLFFKDMGHAGIQFRGHYTGQNNYYFAGLALNELSLIKAECLGRLGDHLGALKELNRLLVKRFRTGSFVPLVASSADHALRLVLSERQKELPFTASLRWEDLKRLNMDPDLAVTLTRRQNGQVFTLPPNDPRYVFPIPDNEIMLTNIPQNER